MHSAKADMIEQMRGRHSDSHASPQVAEEETTASVQTETQGKIAEQERLVDEQDIEEEEYVEEDDQVVVPWGQAVDTTRASPTREEEEGTYSEDEIGK